MTSPPIKRIAMLIALLLCGSSPQALWANPVDTPSVTSPAPVCAERTVPSVFFPALNVADLQATEAFYVKMLGMKPILRIGKEGDEKQEVTLNFSGEFQSPEASLVLNYDASRTEPYVFDGFSRLAFRVKDIDALVERIAKAGYTVLSEPSMIGDTNIRIAFVEDPNHVRVELLEGTAKPEDFE